MKASILLLSLAAATGCCASKGKVTRPDGVVAEFSNYRLLWMTEQYEFGYSTNSLNLRATKSNPDAQTISSITELVKTVKP